MNTLSGGLRPRTFAWQSDNFLKLGVGPGFKWMSQDKISNIWNMRDTAIILLSSSLGSFIFLNNLSFHKSSDHSWRP